MGRWYPGRIARVNLDKSFNVDYDDGEKETRLEAAALVRLVPGVSGKKMAHSPEPPAKLVLGSQVEGNFRGMGRGYPGRIAKVNLDKSFNIDYDDDGEKETRASECGSQQCMYVTSDATVAGGDGQPSLSVSHFLSVSVCRTMCVGEFYVLQS